MIRTLVDRDSRNAGWQHDMSLAYNSFGRALEAQSDESGVFDAYTRSLEAIEALVEQMPSNVGWQLDLSDSCAEFVTLESLSVAERRAHLLRGKKIQVRLKAAGRLFAKDDAIDWFDARLAELDQSDAAPASDL